MALSSPQPQTDPRRPQDLCHQPRERILPSAAGVQPSRYQGARPVLVAPAHSPASLLSLDALRAPSSLDSKRSGMPRAPFQTVRAANRLQGTKRDCPISKVHKERKKEKDAPLLELIQAHQETSSRINFSPYILINK